MVAIFLGNHRFYDLAHKGGGATTPTFAHYFHVLLFSTFL